MSQPITPTTNTTEPSSEASNNPFSTLPPGWTTEADPHDGRLFYWHAQTGTSSWTHPNAPAASHNRKALQPKAPSDDTSFQYTPAPYAATTSTPKAPLPPEENPYVASRRPDNNQCGAIAALILCPPLGIFALYHSIRVDQCWKAGQYSDAIIHGRQAPQYSSWGIMIGAVFWICWFFFRRGRGEWEWPDWRLGD